MCARYLIGYDFVSFFSCACLCHTAMCISHNHIYIPSCLTLSPQPFDSPWWLSQSTKLGSLCYIAASSKFSILHTIVFTRQCYFLNLSYSFLPLTVSTRPVSMSVSPFLSVNRFISTIFLDSIYMC